MEAASSTFLDLVTVLADDVNEGLAYDSISGDEKVDVLTASAVEELIVDGADGTLSIS